MQMFERDLQQTETILNHEFNFKIDLLLAELKKDLAETKADLVRWVVAVGLRHIVEDCQIILAQGHNSGTNVLCNGRTVVYGHNVRVGITNPDPHQLNQKIESLLKKP